MHKRIFLTSQSLLRAATIVVFFLSFSPLSKAQFEVGVFVGGANYQGDLADGVIIWQESKPAFGALLRYTPMPYLTLRANYIQGKLTATDYNSKFVTTRQRGYSFSSNIREFAVVGEFNVLGKTNSANYGDFSFVFNPYIFAGLGVASTDGTPVAPDDTKPYPFPEQGAKNVFLSIPLGLGMKFQVAEFLSIGIEWGGRATFSDYVDGVSKNGNPNKNDWYMFGGLTLTYCFESGGY